jgi:hypothetical protein
VNSFLRQISLIRYYRRKYRSTRSLANLRASEVVFNKDVADYERDELLQKISSLELRIQHVDSENAEFRSEAFRLRSEIEQRDAKIKVMDISLTHMALVNERNMERVKAEASIYIQLKEFGKDAVNPGRIASEKVYVQ